MFYFFLPFQSGVDINVKNRWDREQIPWGFQITQILTRKFQRNFQRNYLSPQILKGLSHGHYGTKLNTNNVYVDYGQIVDIFTDKKAENIASLIS